MCNNTNKNYITSNKGVLSQLPDNAYFPSGEKQTEVIIQVYPMGMINSGFWAFTTPCEQKTVNINIDSSFFIIFHRSYINISLFIFMVINQYLSGWGEVSVS